MSPVVHDLYENAVRRFGDRVALVDPSTTRTYRELWDRATRLAGAFTERGVATGDRVLALMHNCNEWVEVDLATSLIGGVRARLNNRDSRREFAWVLNDTTPKVVVASQEFGPVMLELLRNGEVPKFELATVGPDGDYERWIDSARPSAFPAVRPDDPYVIYHTSGTTGHYKGALYLHRQWVNIYRNVLSVIMDDVTADSVIAHVGPLSHQSGLLVLPGLVRGAPSVMMPHFDPESFFAIVERHRVTHTILAPVLIDMLASHPAVGEHDLSSLRRIYYSGAPIAPSVLRRAIDVFGPAFMQGYGSTEGGTLYNTILYPEQHVEALEHDQRRLSSCGLPVPFFDVKVADNDGNEVPAGEIGEVWVRGDAVSETYWNQPEAAAASHVDGWFRMGDLAVRDEDGFLTIVDRKNDMIVSGGLNVYPREIEDVIAEHPAVAEVAVIGVPDEKWGEAVKACVALRPGATLTLDEVQQHCRTSGLAGYKKPLSLDLVDEMPKTAVGKVFRRALREPYWTSQPRHVS